MPNIELRTKYAGLHTAFMMLHPSQGRVIDPVKLDQMRCNFRTDPAGSLLRDPANNPIPGESSIYYMYMPLNLHVDLRSLLAPPICAAIDALPAGTEYYKVSPFTFHISMFMAQDLRPVDMAEHRFDPEVVLTGDERSAIKQAVHSCVTGTQHYMLNFLGTRFTPDGSIIGVFEDEGQTDRIKAELMKECTAITPKVTKAGYPKDFIHVSLFRMLSDFTAETLGSFQALAEQYLSHGEGFKVEVAQLNFGYETQWMHSRIEWETKYFLKRS